VTAVAWVFMSVSMGAVSVLTFWCLWRVLHAKPPEQ
jgi:hypothetical protein